MQKSVGLNIRKNLLDLKNIIYLVYFFRYTNYKLFHQIN